MNFVVGDIHGECTKLKLLVKNILSTDKNATFIFIGDYTNKGENPYLTLKYLDQLTTKKKCIFIRGNHEYYWESVKENNDEYAASLVKYGAKNTINSINKELSILETKDILFKEFKRIWESLKDYIELDKYVVTHSGISPELYTTNIGRIPRDKFLFNRYDFICLKKYYFNKIMIFGHTGFYSPYFDGYKIGVDTAACYLETQPLTAFCTDADFFINSNNIITKLSDINQSYCPAIPRVKAWQQIN